MKQILSIGFFLILGSCIMSFYFDGGTSPHFDRPLAFVVKQDLKVQIKTLGELEAVRSISIASSIKGDQGKIIDLVMDGIYVVPGQVLVTMDPTPFEEKIEKLYLQVKEQESFIDSLRHTLDWEIAQADHLNQAAIFEVEAAELELNKVINGDGPLEISRLKGVMQKSWLKYEELASYSNDLLELETQGFLNLAEIKQAEKKLAEEKESFHTSQQQYESYINHVHPMQIKKCEIALKRARVAQEQTQRLGIYNTAKSHSILEEASQVQQDYLLQLREAERELQQTKIHAPASGMVVLRDEFRSNQRRKPRVGDILIKNQPLIDLPDLSAMLVRTRVRESDLYKIEIGKKASVQIDAYPELSFKGKIISIGILAITESGRTHEEKYFEVKVALDDSDYRLRPGMTARATIHAQEAENVLTIPVHSIFNDNDRLCVYVSHPLKPLEKRQIEIGIINEQFAEVTKGLEEDESVSLQHF